MDDETAERIRKLEERVEFLESRATEETVKRLAHRDITVRLLAHVARLGGDHETVLREFSESGDARADRIPAASQKLLEALERERREKDWLVETARVILNLPRSETDR